MKKEIIKNREGRNLAILAERADNQKGLAFLMHGFGSFKEHPLLEESSEILRANNYAAVRFDATNSIGGSEGKLEDGTITGYFNDLEDVIIWGRSQNWYQEPFILAGHSLGGYCAALYAAKSPRQVRGVILFSPFVSGKLFLETEEIKPVLDEWKRTGIREWISSSSPGLVKRSKYGFVEDSLNHDLLDVAGKIECPVLLITGKVDKTVPPEHQKLLLDRLNNKDFCVIEGGDHNLKGKEKSQELRDIIDQWSKKISA